MDNVSNHSVTTYKVPINSSRKQDINEWLQERGIYFSPTQAISQLLQQVLLLRRI
jgi:hypothetical protein